MACIQRIFSKNDNFLLSSGVAMDILRGMFFEYLSVNNLGNGGDFTPCDIDVTYYPNDGDILISLYSDLDCNKDNPKCRLVHGIVDCCSEWEYYTYHDVLEEYKGLGSIDQWFLHHYKDIVSKFKNLYWCLN